MASRAQVMAGVKRRAEAAIVRLTVNVQAGLAAATPVDTGFAAGNWQITVGTPAVGTVAIGSGVAFGGDVLAGYKLDQGSIFLTNNAPYVRRLNAGSSQQAPAGFVEHVLAAEVAG